jgi:hypothetical protein
VAASHPDGLMPLQRRRQLGEVSSERSCPHRHGYLKSVFQLHGVDENEVVVVRRQFRRAEMIGYFEKLPPVLVAIESRGSSPR